MSKKSKTTSNQTYNQTSTSAPTVAPWLNSNYQGLGQQISDFAKTDPASYVAGPSDLQSQAFNQAGNLGGWQGLFSQAGSMAQSAAQPGKAASVLDNGGIQSYMNSELQPLIDATLADYDYGAGRQTAAARAAATANKAFNNDRSVFKETELADALTRGRATTSGQLRYDAFDKAAQLALADAQMRQQTGENGLARQLQAAGILGSLGSATGENQRADLSSLLGAGATQQGITQSQLNATPTFLQMLAGLNSSIPIGAFTSMTGTGSGSQQGTSTTKTSDPMGALGGLLGGLGSLTSGLGALKFGA